MSAIGSLTSLVCPARIAPRVEDLPTVRAICAPFVDPSDDQHEHDGRRRRGATGPRPDLSAADLLARIPAGVAPSPPANGLPQAPLLRQALPAAWVPGFRVDASCFDVNAAVAPFLMGLDTEEQLQQLSTHFAEFPIVLGCMALSPDTAAPILAALSARYGPALLSAVAPGGSSAVLLHECGVKGLLDSTLQCCEALVVDGRHGEALTAAAAACDFLSYLRFGSKAAAEPYQHTWRRLRDIVTAAATALGAAAIPKEAVVSLYRSTARADSSLWALPWFGTRFAAALDLHLAFCWESSEAALSFTESWAILVGRGRFHFVAERLEELMSALLSHPLTDAQLQRALAIPALLPVEARLSVRSWSWEPLILQRRRCLLEQAVCAAC